MESFPFLVSENGGGYLLKRKVGKCWGMSRENNISVIVKRKRGGRGRGG